ncbi:hypothetical protein K438DRAFT_1987997 [Mycena galopus ATCC 62051]|nr:hypothetical protein K438DRAFT_1987997 [Mycena galopus ATCC 62051]
MGASPPSGPSARSKMRLAFCSISVSHLIISREPGHISTVHARVLRLRQGLSSGLSFCAPPQPQPHRCPPSPRPLHRPAVLEILLHLSSRCALSLTPDNIYPLASHFSVRPPPSTSRSRCARREIVSAAAATRTPRRRLDPWPPHRARGAKSRRPRLSLAPLGECGRTLPNTHSRMRDAGRDARQERDGRTRYGGGARVKANEWARSTRAVSSSREKEAHVHSGRFEEGGAPGVCFEKERVRHGKREMRTSLLDGREDGGRRDPTTLGRMEDLKGVCTRRDSGFRRLQAHALAQCARTTPAPLIASAYCLIRLCLPLLRPHAARPQCLVPPATHPVPHIPIFIPMLRRGREEYARSLPSASWACSCIYVPAVWRTGGMWAVGGEARGGKEFWKRGE